MLTAKVKFQDSERVKKILLERDLIDMDYKLSKDDDHLFFPLKKSIELDGVEVVERELEQKQAKVTIGSLLKNTLTKEEFSKIPRTQEVVGEIMILEVPEELFSKESEIANAYLQINKNIKTVVKKTDIHSGVFRTRGVKVIAGVDTKETIHRENGVRLRLHLEKTYFSARLAHERMRVANQIVPNEEILVMFSGSAPYPLVLAKHSLAKNIIGVEINPDAHSFGEENIVMNKFQDRIGLVNGDVRDILPTFTKPFDRIIMPLPKTSEEFLDVALPCAKIGGIINMYAFLHEDEILNEGSQIEKICKDLGYTVEIKKAVKCGQHAPYTFRVCFDILVKEKK